MMYVLATLCLVWGVAVGVPVLKHLSWLPIPDNNNRLQPFLGTADRAAWDPQEEYLYVIGSKARTLHIVDFKNHSNPVIVHARAFQNVLDGIPKAIAMCRHGNKEEVAIAFNSPQSIQEGHVEVFRPWLRFDHDLPLLHRVATNMDPSAIKYTATCSHFVVTCEALPGMRNNEFVDPVPHVDIFQETVDGYINIPVSFIGARGLDQARYIFKDTNDNQHSIVNDLEPSDLVIDDNHMVYVTFHENNAIGKFNIDNLAAGVDIYSLGTKDWNNFDIDTSDADISINPDKVNMVRRNIRSFHQPKRLGLLPWNNQSYLITPNTGGVKSYTPSQQGVTFNEAARARTVDASLWDSSLDSATLSQLKTDAELGRLWVSTLRQTTDGWDETFGFFKHAYAYGARSWGIWNSVGITEIYDSSQDLEYFASYNSRNVFNADCLSSGTAPAQTLDQRSDDMGPEPSTIATGMHMGQRLVVVGSGKMGGIWVYEAKEGEAPGILTAEFKSYHRSGSDVSSNWGVLYNNADAGTPYISDLLMVPHHNHQMVIAVGSQMGAIETYEIVDGNFP